MRHLSIAVALTFAALALTATSATAGPTATIDFQLTECQLTITSTKDISNFGLNAVKTEFADGTTTLVIGVAEGDVIDVKSGITTEAFTVTRCLYDNDPGFD